MTGYIDWYTLLLETRTLKLLVNIKSPVPF